MSRLAPVRHLERYFVNTPSGMGVDRSGMDMKEYIATVKGRADLLTIHSLHPINLR